MARTNSCRVATDIAPSAPPNANDPVSPMNTLAGGALNHKKPRLAPIRAPHKVARSPTPGM